MARSLLSALCLSVAVAGDALRSQSILQVAASAGASGTPTCAVPSVKANDKLMVTDASGKATGYACAKHVDWITVGGGQIGLTSLPGRRGNYEASFEWARSLEDDMKTFKSMGADALITLLEDSEIDGYGVSAAKQPPGIEGAAKGAGLKWLHWPVHDFSTVGPRTLAKIIEEGALLFQGILSGKKVIVHCAGGHGRTGTMVAQIIMSLSDSLPAYKSLSLEQRRVKIIADVRAARKDTIETFEQELSVAIGYALRADATTHSTNGNTTGPILSLPFPAPPASASGH